MISASRVLPIHTAAVGRARLRIAGLYRNTRLKGEIEAVARDLDGIRCITANILTGNAVVIFDPTTPLDAIIAGIDRRLPGTGGEPGATTMVAPEPHSWQVSTVRDALRRLDSSRAGLDNRIARKRLAHHGPNALPALPARSRIAMLLGQFKTLPVALLAAAAALSVATGGLADAAVILGVIALNGGIGFVTESRAERTIRALTLPTQRDVPAMRDGTERPIAIAEIVPGDLLVLRPGVIVAADARIVAADDLMLDESLLTGESLPVRKIAKRLTKPGSNLADRVNMAYRGTAVTGGSGLALAVATGRHTELGHIQRLVGEADTPETPLQQQLGRLGRQLVFLSAAICGLVFGIGLWRGLGAMAMLKSSISLAVAALPEGLPTVATTGLAIGIEEMRRRRILIRHLDAVETLAAVGVVCFDKTGTLTENRMSLVAIACGGRRYHVEAGAIRDGQGRAAAAADDADIDRLLSLGALCNETAVTAGDRGLSLQGSPTESALVRAAMGSGIDIMALRHHYPTEAIEYRSEKRPWMVTAHRNGGAAPLMAVKGSPRQVLQRCRWRLQDGRRRPLGEGDRRRIMEENDRMAGAALRVLGVAYGENGTAAAGELTWAGLVGLADPLRPGMARLMARFHRAGIRTVMITGDQAATARALAQELDLAGGKPIVVAEPTGPGVSGEAEIPEAAHAHVFARVTPAQKLRIVQSLQRAGMVVAMTGDGINDSPALKAADIGIALGRGGTDAAREVADIVLERDELETMMLALERGRTTYSNIRKSIHYLLSTNLSEIIVALGAISLGLGPPLTPIQLLWLNLVTDVLPGIGLALEPAEADVLENPPRDPRAPMLNRHSLATLATEAGIISAAALASYGYGVFRYGATPRARSLCFGSLVGAQLLHALTCRSATHGLFDRTGLAPNRALTASLLISFAAQIAAFFVPGLRRLIGVTPLTPPDLLVSAAGAGLPYLVNEMKKTVRPAPRLIR